MTERIYFDNAAATPLAPFTALNFDTCDCHIVTSAIGRPVVLETCRYVVRRGVEITYLPMGLNPIRTRGSLCLTLGRFNTEAEVDRFHASSSRSHGITAAYINPCHAGSVERNEA
jgi:cysteine sulfinate desulfinase/cysteine desulfurase-like protein